MTVYLHTSNLAPKRHVPKRYTVTLDTPLTQEMTDGFAAGVTLADGTALPPAQVQALSPDGLQVQVVLRQGVYHQIKRMFGVYGAGVNALHRDAIGGLALDESLAPGQWERADAGGSGTNYRLKAGGFSPRFQRSITFYR